MADKRMFAKTITGSDAFLDMPLSTQALYFHLGMQADDDGFINSPKKVQRQIGAAEDDLKLLVAKNFIIPFESGVIVVKHWKINNYIRSDRYKPTVYQAEMSMLSVKENGAYQLGIPTDNQLSTTWYTQSRVDKSRVDKSSVVESRELPQPTAPTYESLVEKYGKTLVDDKLARAKRYPNITLETVAKWCEEDSHKQKMLTQTNRRDYDMKELEKSVIEN